MTNCAVIPVNILTGLDAVEKKIVWGQLLPLKFISTSLKSDGIPVIKQKHYI